MKKLFSLLLIIAMLITVMPVNAVEADMPIMYSTGVSKATAGYVTHEVELPESYTPAASEYYANDLTDFQKCLYGAIVEGLTSIETEELALRQAVVVKFSLTVEEVPQTQQQLIELCDAFIPTLQEEISFQNIYDAIAFDHTELFWMRGATLQLSYGASVYSYGTVFDIELSYEVDSSDLFTNDTALQFASADMEYFYEEVVAGIPEGSAITKLEYINEWLKDNNTYNHTHIETDGYPLAHTAYSAMCSQNVEEVGPVCQGYAYAFKLLCDAANIPCVVITGTLYQTYAAPGPHAWNAVKLSDGWYGVDVTSNDSLANDSYNFLVGSQTPSHDAGYPTFAASHVNDTMLAYPTLVENVSEWEIEMAGSNIRMGDKAGLRFRTIVEKNMLFDRYYPTTDDAKTYTYSDDNNLMFGTLLVPKNKITTGSSIVKMFEAGNDLVVDVPAKKIYTQDENTITFTSVITNIPSDAKSFNRDIVAVSYVKYRENESSEWTYVYATDTNSSYYKVAKAARESDYSDANNPSPTPEMKAIMEELDEIIKLVDDDKGWIQGWY